MQVPDGMEVGEWYAFITIIPSVPMKDMGDDPIVRNVFRSLLTMSVIRVEVLISFLPRNEIWLIAMWTMWTNHDMVTLFTFI